MSNIQRHWPPKEVAAQIIEAGKLIIEKAGLSHQLYISELHLQEILRTPEISPSQSDAASKETPKTYSAEVPRKYATICVIDEDGNVRCTP